MLYHPKIKIPKIRTDLIINASDETETKLIHSHKIILIMLSEFFNKLFSGNYKESNQNTIDITVNNVDIFELIIEALYDPNLEPEYNGSKYDFLMNLYMEYRYLQFYDKPEVDISEMIDVPITELDHFKEITGYDKYPEIKDDKIKTICDFTETELPKHDESYNLIDFSDQFDTDLIKKDYGEVNLINWLLINFPCEHHNGIRDCDKNYKIIINFYNIDNTISETFYTDSLICSKKLKPQIYLGKSTFNIYLDLKDKTNVVNAYKEWLNKDNFDYFKCLKTIDDIFWFIKIFKDYEFTYFN